MAEEEWDEFPPTPLLLNGYMHYVLFLLDHTALGTHSFEQQRDRTLTDPTRKFLHTDHTPISRPFDKWHLDPYRSTLSKPTPFREGPDTERASTQEWINLDQSFCKDRKLPTMTWAEHARPRYQANPLASAKLAAPEAPILSPEG